MENCALYVDAGPINPVPNARRSTFKVLLVCKKNYEFLLIGKLLQ